MAALAGINRSTTSAKARQNQSVSFHVRPRPGNQPPGQGVLELERAHATAPVARAIAARAAATLTPAPCRFSEPRPRSILCFHRVPFHGCAFLSVIFRQHCQLFSLDGHPILAPGQIRTPRQIGTVNGEPPYLDIRPTVQPRPNTRPPLHSCAVVPSHFKPLSVQQ